MRANFGCVQTPRTRLFPASFNRGLHAHRCATETTTQHSGRGKAPPLKGASPSATPFPLLPPGSSHRGPRAEVPPDFAHSRSVARGPLLFPLCMSSDTTLHDTFTHEVRLLGIGDCSLQVAVMLHHPKGHAVASDHTFIALLIDENRAAFLAIKKQNSVAV